MDNDWPDYYADPVGHCVAALKHGNEDERFNAADILRGLATDAESAIPALLEAMQSDEDHQVRAQCAFAIIGMGAMLKERVAFAVPPLVKTLLTDQDAETRSLAADALKAIGPSAKEAVPALRQALQDENEWVRNSAQKALSLLDSN